MAIGPACTAVLPEYRRGYAALPEYRRGYAAHVAREMCACT